MARVAGLGPTSPRDAPGPVLGHAVVVLLMPEQVVRRPREAHLVRAHEEALRVGARCPVPLVEVPRRHPVLLEVHGVAAPLRDNLAIPGPLAPGTVTLFFLIAEPSRLGFSAPEIRAVHLQILQFATFEFASNERG